MEKKVGVSKVIWDFIKSNDVPIKTTEKKPPELMSQGRKWARTRKMTKKSYSIDSKANKIRCTGSLDVERRP